MRTLTLEHATANKLTPNDCVRFFNPEASDELCEFILWEKTCFPFSNEIMIKQLNETFNTKEK